MQQWYTSDFSKSMEIRVREVTEESEHTWYFLGWLGFMLEAMRAYSLSVTPSPSLSFYPLFFTFCYYNWYFFTFPSYAISNPSYSLRLVLSYHSVVCFVGITFHVSGMYSLLPCMDFSWSGWIWTASVSSRRVLLFLFVWATICVCL